MDSEENKIEEEKQEETTVEEVTNEENNNEELTEEIIDEKDEETKKSIMPTIIIVLVLIILTVGGTIIYIKKDELFKSNDNQKVEEKQEQNNSQENEKPIEKEIENKEEQKEEEKQEEQKEENKYENQSGSLSTENDSSALIKINGKDYKLMYSFIEEENGPGKMNVKLNDKVIFELIAFNGIWDLTYNVFTAADNKQYLFVSYKQWGEFGFIVNDEGKELHKISEYSDDLRCFVGTNENEDLMYALGEEVYYYRYKKDSKSDDDKIKLEQVKISINNNSISESLTGEEKDGKAAQCG